MHIFSQVQENQVSLHVVLVTKKKVKIKVIN